MTTITRPFLTDPGHGWLAVEMRELTELGIADRISKYSYQTRDGLVAYLEEDCDMPTYMEAQIARGVTVNFREEHTDKDSPVRRLPSYNQRVKA